MTKTGRPAGKKKGATVLYREWVVRYKAKGYARSTLFVDKSVRDTLVTIARRMGCSYHCVLLNIDFNKILDSINGQTEA